MKNPFQKNLTNLALKLKRGDIKAAEALYNNLIDKVFGFCMNRTSNRAVSEDLTQDIFLKLLDRIETFDKNRGNFLVWFWQLARNTLTDYYRRGKETSFSDTEEAKLEKSANPVSHPDLDPKIKAEKVYTFVKSLSDEEKELFELHFIADLKYRDLAEILGKSEGTLRVAVSRLKQKIHKQFPLLVS